MSIKGQTIKCLMVDERKDWAPMSKEERRALYARKARACIEHTLETMKTVSGMAADGEDRLAIMAVIAAAKIEHDRLAMTRLEEWR